jgi:putative tryptophan/tyrosine transport system substrate-binding protein
MVAYLGRRNFIAAIGGPMRRRDLIAALGGAAAAAAAGWPVASRAQQRDGMRRVGVLIGGSENNSAVQSELAVFIQEMARLG